MPEANVYRRLISSFVEIGDYAVAIVVVSYEERII